MKSRPFSPMAALLLAASLVSPVFAQAAPIVQILKSNAQNYAIDAGEGASNRQNVELMTADESSTSQQWLEIDRGDGYYSYQKVDTDFCIDGNSGGAKSQNVYLWTCDENNYNQHWQKVDVDGAVQLVKRNADGFALNGGGGGADGQNISLWVSSSPSKNLHWVINELSSVEPVLVDVASVTATADDGNVPANTLDFDLNTRWSALGDGQAITFELAETVDLGRVDIAFFKGDQRTANIEIQVSADGNSWQTVFDGEQPELTLEPIAFQLESVSANYVRIVGHMNSANSWNSLTSVEFYTAGSYTPADDNDVVTGSDDWMKKIQLYGHGYSVPTDFTDEEYQYIANTFKVFTVEKRHAYNSYGGNPSTERATIGTAQKLKAINPDIKVLLYWNSVLNYEGLYEANTNVFSQHPEWVHSIWTMGSGNEMEVYDLENPDCQDWWVDTVVSIIEEGNLDGVFVDAGPKANALGLSDALGVAMTRVRERIGEDKIVIFNGYRVTGATNIQAGPELIDDASGVFVEFFLHAPLDTKEEAALLFDELTKVFEMGDKTIGLRGSSSHYLPGAEDPFLFTFASMMLFYGPNTYWLYNDSYNKTAWMYDYKPEYYDIATGASLGGPTRDGWVYTREFENISVRVDLENVTASITYKN